jgi:hypothetical protein
MIFLSSIFDVGHFSYCCFFFFSFFNAQSTNVLVFKSQMCKAILKKFNFLKINFFICLNRFDLLYQN